MMRKIEAGMTARAGTTEIKALGWECARERNISPSDFNASVSLNSNSVLASRSSRFRVVVAARGTGVAVAGTLSLSLTLVSTSSHGQYFFVSVQSIGSMSCPSTAAVTIARTFSARGPGASIGMKLTACDARSSAKIIANKPTNCSFMVSSHLVVHLR